jgi:heme exporter protein C
MNAHKTLSAGMRAKQPTREGPWGPLAIALTALLIVVSLYLIFLYAPRERVMGDVQRIFYLHLPLAWNGLLAFAVTFVLSILYLRTRRVGYDRWAAASAEVGLVFTTLMLLTGSLWARAAWGTYWTWEPRLTTAFLLWLMYAFYLILRRYIENKEKMHLLVAAYGIVAFINVPIVFMSIRWWRTLHPVVLKTSGFQMEPEMVTTLMVALFSFTVFYGLLLWERARLGRLEEELERLRERIREV